MALDRLIIMLRLVFILVTAAYAAKFRRLDNVSMTDSLYNVTEMTAPTADRCMMKCPEDNCMGMSWNEADDSCKLFHTASTPTYEGMKFSESAGWTTYYQVVTYSANKMAASSADCPSTWIHNSELGSCYHFTNTSGSYDEVLSECQSFKPGYSKLVMVDNENEKDYLLNHTITNALDSNRYWIGMRRSLDMTWFSSAAEKSWPMIYENWSTNEPSNINEECIVIRTNGNGEWNDVSCSGDGYGICEIDVELGSNLNKLYYR